MNKIKRNIIFDGQLFQSAAWNRGMGKYSLCLLRALFIEDKYNYEETYIIFTKHMELKDEARKAIANAIPSAKMLFLDLRVPKDPNLPIKNLQDHNSKILKQLVAEQTNKTDFFILSLFIDQVCTVFPKNARKILLFYDLIPLQYNIRYGLARGYPNYLSRFKTLFESDVILTISQTVADDIATYLGINNKHIFNINGAAIDRNFQLAQKPAHFRDKRYVLMPSGNELRKNNFRAVQAFELYRKRYGDSNIKLVLTSFFDDETKQQLLQQSSNLIFTGNVPESNLLWLYKNATTILFVSEYEGLGLPVLEAIEANKPIVCSELTTFNEMSKTAFYYADQFNPVDIAEALKSAIDKVDFEQKISEYSDILYKYNWSNSASKAMMAIFETPDLDEKIKPRVAIFAPNPSGYSAIGKVVMLLHPQLSKHFDIDYYIEDGKTSMIFERPSYLPYIAKTYKASAFNVKTYRRYDAVIYHIGNSEYHVETIKNALYLPGFVIIHDTHLKSIFHSELLEYSYVDEKRLEMEQKLNLLQKTQMTSYLSSIANGQLGIVVHSKYAHKALKETCVVDIPIISTNLPVATPKIIGTKRNKKFTVGFAGIIHEAKGVNIVEKIANSATFSDINVSIFGIPLIPADTMSRLESYPNVNIETNLTDFEFQTKLSKLDVLINYRPYYNGETSLTTIEAMRFGVVPIVRNIGWFKELPNDCVLKASTVEQVIDLLEDFRLDIQKREFMSKNAQEFMKKKYSYENYAQDLVKLVDCSKKVKKSTNHLIEVAIKKHATMTSLKNIITKL